jgi:glucose/arabinose dehydrogenase
MPKFSTLLYTFFLFTVPVFSQYQLEKAFPNLSFSNPIGIYESPDSTNRLFVVEQDGIIKVFQNNPATTSAKDFLDISGMVTVGSETGLLGLAFHPDFKNNGYFYIDYTPTINGQLQTHISRFKVSNTNPDSADPSSELILISQNQPYSNHNGGQMAFGPEGYLYIGFGDGGSGGDPQGNGQSDTTLLGKILRIDVDHTNGLINYSIPPDNPFAGNTSGYKKEIYAYGLRNPWRFSFDKQTNSLWCGDVGQNNWEEIDIIENGKNYGWNIMEGFHCYSPANGCSTAGLTMPIWEYDHSSGNCAIIGGFVYHGTDLPQLDGKFIFGDYCSRTIWALTFNPGVDTSASVIATTGSSIFSFGTDSNNNIYVCESDGNIYKLTQSVTNSNNISSLIRHNIQLQQNYPNPFNPSTEIRYSIPSAMNVKIIIYDATGRMIRELENGYQNAGLHQVMWNGSDNYNRKVSSGIYFYRLITENFSQTKAMVLLK